MRILITGAGGFVGRALVRALCDAHQVIAVDRHCSGLGAAETIEGDLTDQHVIDRAIGNGCDAVVHLATVPGGAAEQDPDSGWRVNVDGSAALLAELTRLATPPRFIFASSIAALGNPPATGVDDATPLRPTMVYGAHKAMIEQWIATLSRRGSILGLAVRLPGIVARPQGPSGMKSAFMSDVFHALLATRPFVSPVSPDATMWMMSIGRVVDNFRRAVEAVEPVEPYALTLPALRISMAELVAEIARQTDRDPALITFDPDQQLENAFGRYPALHTGLASKMGFSDDGSVAELVTAVLHHIRQGN